MITISQAVIVEGKYDKIKLSSLIDALIIEINGFHIFKDKEKAELIKTLAMTRGIIIMTDSDSAGLQLRNKIEEIAKGGIVYNAYIPEILGKEKRKSKQSKQGFLGVEGVDKDIIINSLKKCGLEQRLAEFRGSKITSATLYNLNITGKANSSRLKAKLLEFLNLPSGLSKNNLLKILEHTMSAEELESIINKITEVN